MHVDVAVLGAGPGGYVAAIRAAQLGKRVAVIEVQHWGGVCLNVGCVPMRALLRNAELAHVINHRAAAFGISGDVTLDYGVALDRSRQVADGRVKGVHYLMRKNGIVEIDGWGTFRDDHTIEVALVQGGTETVTFDSAVIATGSTVRTLPGIELSANITNYEPLVRARSVPKSIVIVGAGAIGTEVAFLLNSYGAEVTLIELADRILPDEDPDVSKELARQYRRLGINVLAGAEVQTVVDHGDSVTICCADSGGSGTTTLHAERMLIAVGFAPRTAGYGLEHIGVTLTGRGAIAVDEVLRTSVPHLHAIGDVTAKLQRAHVAEAQAVVAAETIAGIETTPIGDYRAFPRATFCQPETASFGLTEQQARGQGRDVRVAKYPLTANAKAQALGQPAGFAKLVADTGSGVLLGAHLIGPGVSELLPALTLANRQHVDAAHLARNIHVHPTISEALQECYHGLLDHMINL